MLWKIIIILLCLWSTVYTVSYGIFEYKNKNPLGATGVFALGALVAVALLEIVVSSI